MSTTPASLGYPEPRERGPVPAPREAGDYESYESTDGEVTCGDTDADVLVCSGDAQKFLVSARTNGAIVTITDRVRAEDHGITIPAGEPVWIRVPGNVVRARNLVAGSNAALSVAAFYDTHHTPWRQKPTA